MKYLFVILLLVLNAPEANAGQFIARNMFSVFSTVQGTGSTEAAAEKDALSAIPDGYELDPRNSKASDCGELGDTVTWNKIKQDYDCSSSTYRLTAVVVPKDSKNLEKELHGRRKFKSYEGIGLSPEIAKQNMKMKIPKNSYVESWGLSCTVKTETKAETGEGPICDTKIPGNLFKAMASIPVE